MTKSLSNLTKTLLALAVAGSMAAFTAQPAAAQTASKLKCSGCVKSKQIKNGKVKGKDLKDSTVTGGKIAPNAVDGSKISDGAVGSSEVAADSIPAADLSDETGLEFINNNGFTTDIDVTTTYAVMASLAVSAPGAGFVLCTAAGQADWDAAATTLALEIGWDTTGGTSAPVSTNFTRANNTDVTDLRIPITAMHTFTVASAGTTTYSLKARCISCGVDAMDFSFHNAACVYYPTQY